MATRKRGRPPKERGTAMAAAASAMAAAASISEDDDGEDTPTAARGQRLTDVAADTIATTMQESTREPRSTVKRLSDYDNKYATLDIVDAALVNEEWIQRTYGGGKYRVLTLGPLRDGKWGYISNAVYEIDASVPFRGALMGRTPPKVHNADGSVAGAERGDTVMTDLVKSQMIELVQSQSDVRRQDREGSSTIMSMMVNMMKESSDRNDRFMQLMMTMMSQKPSGPNLTELLGAITPLIAPLLTTRKDPIEMATQLMALTASGRGGGSQLSEIIGAIKELRETADLFGSNDKEPEDASLLGTITRMAPQLLGMLSQQQQRELATAPAQPPAFQPNPPVMPMIPGQPMPAMAQPEDESGMGMVTMMLRPYAGMLVERAMADDDPFDLGHSVALMIPVAMRDSVAAFIERESAAAEVIAAIPELAPYPAWVTGFVDGIRERYNPTEDDDADGESVPPMIGTLIAKPSESA